MAGHNVEIASVDDPCSGRWSHSHSRLNYLNAAHCVAIMNGRRDGFIIIKDMYNDDVGKGGVRVYEAYEVK